MTGQTTAETTLRNLSSKHVFLCVELRNICSVIFVLMIFECDSLPAHTLKILIYTQPCKGLLLNSNFSGQCAIIFGNTKKWNPFTLPQTWKEKGGKYLICKKTQLRLFHFEFLWGGGERKIQVKVIMVCWFTRLQNLQLCVYWPAHKQVCRTLNVDLNITKWYNQNNTEWFQLQVT